MEILKLILCRTSPFKCIAQLFDRSLVALVMTLWLVGMSPCRLTSIAIDDGILKVIVLQRLVTCDSQRKLTASCDVNVMELARR